MELAAGAKAAVGPECPAYLSFLCSMHCLFCLPFGDPFDFALKAPLMAVLM